MFTTKRERKSELGKHESTDSIEASRVKKRREQKQKERKRKRKRKEKEKEKRRSKTEKRKRKDPRVPPGSVLLYSTVKVAPERGAREM